MAAVGDNIVRYIYRGGTRGNIPDGVTHVIVDKDVTIILNGAFEQHTGIIEVICHDNVETIEDWAFTGCRSLRRVIMRGVKIVGMASFAGSLALTDVECGKLEIIGNQAFRRCKSLRSIDLPSARTVTKMAFDDCEALTEAKFGSKLETFEEHAFADCPSLEGITIPLKDGLITNDNIFHECKNLVRVDIVEGAMQETISALHYYYIYVHDYPFP